MFICISSDLFTIRNYYLYLFQVFVANPNKAQPILDILLKNKDKLVEFLTQFHTDRTGQHFINNNWHCLEHFLYYQEFCTNLLKLEINGLLTLAVILLVVVYRVSLTQLDAISNTVIKSITSVWSHVFYTVTTTRQAATSIAVVNFGQPYISSRGFKTEKDRWLILQKRCKKEEQKESKNYQTPNINIYRLMKRNLSTSND